MLFCGKDKLILPTRMSRFKYSSFLHILRHSEAKMSFMHLSSCFCFHLDRLISIWVPCCLSVISDHLQPLFSHFRSILTILTVFSITLDYSRLLSITLDYSRLLSITLDYSRLLSTTLDYSFDRSRLFFWLASSLFDGFWHIFDCVACFSITLRFLWRKASERECNILISALKIQNMPKSLSCSVFCVACQHLAAVLLFFC